ncbi:hypothetical protein HYX19_04405 [Candidatus Woesearchaeota archaeon]|nr:hypothetical protein [Candidatus Woesearchaeota archaeon]
MDGRSVDEFVKNSNVLTGPFGLNQWIPILIYIVSIGIVGIIILLTYFK